MGVMHCCVGGGGVRRWMAGCMELEHDYMVFYDGGRKF